MVAKMMDLDSMLTTMASEVVKAGGDVRAQVRDLTVKALQTRELSLAQIRQVVRSVTEGISKGSAATRLDSEKPLQDALEGMDDALRKAVQASQIALQQLTDHQADFVDSKMRKALSDLEKLEDEFLKTVKESTEGASRQIREKWAAVLAHQVPGGTATGAQVEALMERFGEPARAAMRQQREAGLKVAHMLTQNFATLASGVLMGLSEGLQQPEPPASAKRKTRNT